MRVNVERAQPWTAGRAERLSDGPYFFGSEGNSPQHDVSRDDRRFLMVKEPTSAAAPPSMIVVQNWTQELKRLVSMR